MHAPEHIAIIMDGNGRWAQAKGRNRTAGHLKGARVAKKIISECARIGIPNLTLYAFSSENWFRPFQEISFLMNLLGRHLRRERLTLIEQNIRFQTLGEIHRLPVEVQDELQKTIEVTSKNTGMNLTFALSYGSRQEIVFALRNIVTDIQAGKLNTNQIDQDLVSTYLESSFLPDPDFIIRTSGESRLSNFMLWQAAYSELYITPTLWPDFTEDDLHLALQSFSKRERRFGRVVTGGGTSICVPSS